MAATLDGMDDIIKEFLAESSEDLDVLERDLVALERAPGSGDLLAEIFRSVHTLKGNSGALGYPKLESIAHAGETLLARLRDGKLELTSQLTNGLLAMVDALRGLLKRIEDSGNEGDSDCTAVTGSLNLMSEKDPACQRGEVQKVSSLVPYTDSISTSDGVSGKVKVNTAAKLLSEATGISSTDAVAASAGNIRVGIADLDRMMNLVGELTLARNQILHFAAESADTGLGAAAQLLKSVSTGLQQAVMRARMQPIGKVWNGFPRLVRDMAAKCGKQIALEMKGSEIELDRTILEAIKDPLTHVLRNAIDHGIERPDDRVGAGKSGTGHISLSAFHEGGRVYVEIRDDGAGIDVSRVLRRALEIGLITAEQSSRMSEREIAHLVFTPGLSTAENVTRISGRGVGLDVVRTNIEKVGGVVDLDSVAGQGITLKINLPLTLAILPALVVGCGDQRFAIPQANLVEVAAWQAEQKPNPIEQTYGGPVYRRRGQMLPLVFLGHLLGLPQSGTGVIHVVVLQAGARQFGLVVDTIGDCEEIVAKSLSKQLKELSCYAGATVLGDGRAALILDVMGLAQLAQLSTSLGSQSYEPPTAVETSSIPARQTWVTFRGVDGSHFGLPMSAVAHLEEVPAQRVERTRGREVVQCRGEIVPLLRTADLFHQPSPERDPLQVIMLRQGNRRVGLVVDQIEDIVEESLEPQGSRQTGFLRGTAIIQDSVAGVFDVDQLLELAGKPEQWAAPEGRYHSGC